MIKSIMTLMICLFPLTTAHAQDDAVETDAKVAKPNSEDSEGLLDKSSSWIKQKYNETVRDAEDYFGDDEKATPQVEKSSAEKIKKPSKKHIPDGNKTDQIEPQKLQKPEAPKPSDNKGIMAKIFLIEPAENQGFLIEIVEEIVWGDATFISNELNLGLYSGKNLFNLNVAFVYGGSNLGRDYIFGDNVRYELNASYYGAGLSFRWHREFWPGWFPYIGLTRTKLFGEIKSEIVVGDTDDSVSIPTQSYDLTPIEIDQIDTGLGYRIHFWKVLTVGTAVGFEIPFRVSKLKYKAPDEEPNDEFNQGLKKAERMLKSPRIDVNINFGFAF